MDQWIIQNRSINPENGINVSIPAGPLDPNDYAENAIYFPNGELALFVKDGNVFNSFGIFITSLLLDYNANCQSQTLPPLLNKEISMGYSETLIVKVPGSNCNDFYIINSFARKSNLKDRADWGGTYIVKNALIYLKVHYLGNNEWTVVPDQDLNCTTALVISQDNLCGINTPHIGKQCLDNNFISTMQAGNGSNNSDEMVLVQSRMKIINTGDPHYWKHQRCKKMETGTYLCVSLVTH